MARFIVEGGTPLRGEIRPAGNKNEALTLIAAALLTDEPVTLHNVPRIRDVRGMLEIASALGAKVEELDPKTIRITAAGLKSQQIPASLSREIRASLLFAAPLVARLKHARLGPPGGDVIGRRRNDTHFLALKAFGAELDTSAGAYELKTSGLVGADVMLDEASVTATENSLMAAVLAKGRTTIYNAASEPHVQQLGVALMKMGARILGAGTNKIVIDGVDRLKGIDHTLLNDHMEVGSLIATTAMTHGEVTIRDAVPSRLRSPGSRVTGSQTNVTRVLPASPRDRPNHGRISGLIRRGTSNPYGSAGSAGALFRASTWLAYASSGHSAQ